MPVLEDRVETLEETLQTFITSVGIEFNKLYNSQMRTEAELRAFKEEMKEFKDEMRVFKSEMTDFKDEMKEFKRDINKKWGEMSKKLGTIVEDMVAPSIPDILKKEFNIETMDLMIRRKKRLTDGRIKEYDAIAVTDDYIFINSTKSTLRIKDIPDAIEEISLFREFFPEYDGKKIIGILASLYVDEGFIQSAEREGFMVLAVGDGLMEVKNTTGFKPKEW